MAQPQSRSEAIVRATIDGEEYKGLPQSRLEALLIELNHGGGGGGTTSYNALEDLPTIEGREIKGEVSDDILGLVAPLTDEDVKDIDDILEDDPNGN